MSDPQRSTLTGEQLAELRAELESELARLDNEQTRGADSSNRV